MRRRAASVLPRWEGEFEIELWELRLDNERRFDLELWNYGIMSRSARG